MTSVKELRTKLERRKGQKIQIEKNIEAIQVSLSQSRKDLRTHTRAREVIKKVGLETQQQLSFNISEVTSMALNAVLDKPYELEVEFVEKRNKTECKLWFARNGDLIKPFDGGGGALDVAAFALRVASWSMQFPRTRNVLILDEPFKHLKGEESNRKVLEMVREISSKLGLQIIMVSDERISREATIEAADKVFETSIKKGVTNVSEG
ncbi:hypothetical protein LCGC14_2399620 [marine sediment metagenome]|uniref:RecF/RecN/SMC N-terminal domain-containing protein n=1 Tax=marine sediment metagenome TaxID=412755 RepID=A0A0F9BVT6_9ZZZZ